MKVLVVNNMAPFVWGGAEELAENLRIALISMGHEAEILRIPFRWEPTSAVPNQMAMVNKLELANVDKVIALKFPAYLIRHPNKTIWLLHQFRQAYDLLESGNSSSSTSDLDRQVIDIVRGADNFVLSNTGKIFCNSQITKDRLRKFNDLNAEILLPPVNDSHLFKNVEYRNYIFAGGRVNSMKRQELLLRSVAHTDENVKLVIAGPPESPDYKKKIEDLAVSLGVQHRVELNLNFMDRGEYANYVNNCAAVAYVPYDEDSYGYVAMEGAQASKPIITTIDSGGVSRFVNNEIDGWVCEPNEKSLARAMSSAIDEPLKTKEMGSKSKLKLDELGLTWEHTVRKLLE